MCSFAFRGRAQNMLHIHWFTVWFVCLSDGWDSGSLGLQHFWKGQRKQTKKNLLTKTALWRNSQVYRIWMWTCRCSVDFSTIFRTNRTAFCKKTLKKIKSRKPTFNHLPELCSHQTSSLAVPLPRHAFQSRPAPAPAFDSHQRNPLPAVASSLTVLAVLFIFLVSSACSSKPPTYAQEPAANSVITPLHVEIGGGGGVGVVSLSV